MSQAQQIAGYLKLTSAHYYLRLRHDPSPCLELRSVLAREMSVETILIADELKRHLGGMYYGEVKS